MVYGFVLFFSLADDDRPRKCTVQYVGNGPSEDTVRGTDHVETDTSTIQIDTRARVTYDDAAVIVG